MPKPSHSLRYYVSLWSGRLLVFSGLFLLQVLLYGSLTLLAKIYLGPVPIQSILFLMTSVIITRRYFHIQGIE